MRAAIFTGVGNLLEIREIPDPTPGPDQLIIKVGRCGICGTDVTMTSGHGCMTLPPGALIGHEFAGVVVATGSATSGFRVGDRVAAPPVQGCGQCAACQVGKSSFCTSAVFSSGGFAEYTAVGARESILLPSTVTMDDGALVEPMAVGRQGVRLANMTKGDRVLVIGPGPIGLAAIFFARLAGAGRIAALASSSRREAMARSLGADAFVLQGPELAERVAAELGGPPDIVIEAAGVPGVIAQALDLVRPMGTVVSLGFCTVPDSFVPAAAMMKEIHLQFSMTYDQSDFQACVDVFDAGHPDPRLMITDSIGLHALPAMLEALRSSSSHVKVLVDPQR